MKSFSTAMLCLSLALGTVEAQAQSNQDPSPKGGEAIAAQAFELYNKGEYVRAITLYLKAYQAEPAAAIIFNVARIYDQKLHDRVLAIDYYQRYLSAPDAEPELVQRANERIIALRSE